MYKGARGMERVDREDLFTIDNRTRGHEYKMKMKWCLSDTVKYSFPNRTVDSGTSKKKKY